MEQWVVDKAHSEIEFSVRHMMISTVKGQFKDFEIDLNGSPDEPEKVSVNARIMTASVYTRDETRDGHLRSADFFDAEKHPVMTFKSDKVKALDKNHFEVSGSLTIRDVTKPVTLSAEIEGRIKDPYGKDRIGLSVTGSINRKDFGLQWNMILEGGGLMVGDKVNMAFHLEATKNE